MPGSDQAAGLDTNTSLNGTVTWNPTLLLRRQHYRIRYHGEESLIRYLCYRTQVT
jgi:hypothetical protein